MEYKHFGVYGLLIKDDRILLIKKVGGPYDGKLDLPGGTIEFGEKPSETLKREFLEEVGILVNKYELCDSDSVIFDWLYNDKVIKVHHTGVFYKILDFQNEIKNDVKIDSKNDDSLGAAFYEIDKLTRDELSNIAIVLIEKLGYEVKF